MTKHQVSIAPMVPLRALREARGLTTPELATRIAEFGVTVHPDSLINIELGNRGAGPELQAAWARALNIKPLDIRHATDLAEIFTGAIEKIRPSDPKVHLVLYDNGQICTALVDNPDLAEKRARAVGGVIVELPILKDYREKATQ